MVRFILLAAFFVVLALIAYVFSENPDWSASFEVFGYRLTLHLGFVFFGLEEVRFEFNGLLVE